MENLMPNADDGSASFEGDGRGNNMWNCFHIVGSYFCDLPQRTDMSCGVYGIEVTRTCVQYPKAVDEVRNLRGNLKGSENKSCLRANSTINWWEELKLWVIKALSDWRKRWFELPNKIFLLWYSPNVNLSRNKQGLRRWQANYVTCLDCTSLNLHRPFIFAYQKSLKSP